jgi:hypothetical protein
MKLEANQSLRGLSSSTTARETKPQSHEHHAEIIYPQAPREQCTPLVLGGRRLADKPADQSQRENTHRNNEPVRIQVLSL